jgi:hypothetical protein
VSLRTSTYPEFPQPILRNPSDGRNYYLEVANDGSSVSAAGRTTDAVTDLPRVTLLDAAKLAAYQLQLSGGGPTVGVSAAKHVSMGCYDFLSCWSKNGREWQLQVSAAGALTIAPLSYHWDTPKVTHLTDQNGQYWPLSVSDGGIYAVTTPSAENQQGMAGVSAILATRDGSAAFKLKISVDGNGDGIIQVEDGYALTEALGYELELISPRGFSYLLYVEPSGLVMIDDTPQANGRDSWPLVLIPGRKPFVFIVDERFPPPIAGVNRKWGVRRRTMKR